MIHGTGNSTRRNKRFRGEYIIPVDRRIADEIRSACGKNENRLYAATAFLLQAMRDKERCFRANTKILDHMSGYAGQDCRAKLIRMWNASQHIKTAKQYLAGSHCTIRQYAPRGGVVPTHQKPRHKMVSCHSDSGGSNRLPGGVRWWLGGCDGVLVLPAGWYRGWGKSYRTACREMWPEQWAFADALEWSLSQCVILDADVTADWWIGEAEKRIEEWLSSGVPKRQRRARRTTPETLAKQWMAIFRDVADDPLSDLQRIDGRAYYGLTRLPRPVRRRLICLLYHGQYEPIAEVDMSACYWVVIASLVPRSTDRDRLIHLLMDGTFYDKLNELLDVPYANKEQLKVETQRQCLFGSHQFGKGPLFRALVKLVPAVADWIWRQRTAKNKAGWRRSATALSHKLNEGEGAFMLDQLLIGVRAEGIPDLSIHDAVLVPQSTTHRVKSMAETLAEQHFGFKPLFKVKGLPA